MRYLSLPGLRSRGWAPIFLLFNLICMEFARLAPVVLIFIPFSLLGFIL